MRTLKTPMNRIVLSVSVFLGFGAKTYQASVIDPRNNRLGRLSTGDGSEEPAPKRENASPGEFPYYAQWGGCGATLVWEDILLTSAAVSSYVSRRICGLARSFIGRCFNLFIVANFLSL